MNLHYPHLFLCQAALLASLTGCSQSDTAADSSAAGDGRSYELVTVERPESVEHYHRLYKAGYEMCAGTRALLKLPPAPPMLQPAKDYIINRTTHTSDGQAYLIRQEYFTYKMETDGDAMTCRTYLEKVSDTQLVRDGKVYDAYFDPQGKREGGPPQESSLPRDKPSEIYTIPKVSNGIALKCMEMLPNTEKLITELCAVDLKPGTLTDSIGKPLTASSRVTAVDDIQGVIVTEPVSLRVGHKVDKAVFDAAAAP